MSLNQKEPTPSPQQSAGDKVRKALSTKLLIALTVLALFALLLLMNRLMADGEATPPTNVEVSPSPSL